MENVEKFWKKRENDSFMEIERRELRFESCKIEISVRNMMVIGMNNATQRENH